MNVKEVPHAPRMQIVPIRMDLLIVLANLDLKETGLLVTVSEIQKKLVLLIVRGSSLKVSPRNISLGIKVVSKVFQTT